MKERIAAERANSGGSSVFGNLALVVDVGLAFGFGLTVAKAALNEGNTRASRSSVAPTGLMLVPGQGTNEPPSSGASATVIPLDRADFNRRFKVLESRLTHAIDALNLLKQQRQHELAEMEDRLRRDLETSAGRAFREISQTVAAQVKQELQDGDSAHATELVREAEEQLRAEMRQAATADSVEEVERRLLAEINEGSQRSTREIQRCVEQLAEQARNAANLERLVANPAEPAATAAAVEDLERRVTAEISQQSRATATLERLVSKSAEAVQEAAWRSNDEIARLNQIVLSQGQKAADVEHRLAAVEAQGSTLEQLEQRIMDRVSSVENDLASKIENAASAQTNRLQKVEEHLAGLGSSVDPALASIVQNLEQRLVQRMAAMDGIVCKQNETIQELQDRTVTSDRMLQDLVLRLSRLRTPDGPPAVVAAIPPIPATPPSPAAGTGGPEKTEAESGTAPPASAAAPVPIAQDSPPRHTLRRRLGGGPLALILCAAVGVFVILGVIIAHFLGLPIGPNN